MFRPAQKHSSSKTPTHRRQRVGVNNKPTTTSSKQPFSTTPTPCRPQPSLPCDGNMIPSPLDSASLSHQQRKRTAPITISKATLTTHNRRRMVNQSTHKQQPNHSSLSSTLNFFPCEGGRGAVVVPNRGFLLLLDADAVLNLVLSVFVMTSTLIGGSFAGAKIHQTINSPARQYAVWRDQRVGVISESIEQQGGLDATIFAHTSTTKLHTPFAFQLLRTDRSLITVPFQDLPPPLPPPDVIVPLITSLDQYEDKSGKDGSENINTQTGHIHASTEANTPFVYIPPQPKDPLTFSFVAQPDRSDPRQRKHGRSRFDDDDEEEAKNTDSSKTTQKSYLTPLKQSYSALTGTRPVARYSLLNDHMDSPIGSKAFRDLQMGIAKRESQIIGNLSQTLKFLDYIEQLYTMNQNNFIQLFSTTKIGSQLIQSTTRGLVSPIFRDYYKVIFNRRFVSFYQQTSFVESLHSLCGQLQVELMNMSGVLYRDNSDLFRDLKDPPFHLPRLQSQHNETKQQSHHHQTQATNHDPSTPQVDKLHSSPGPAGRQIHYHHPFYKNGNDKSEVTNQHGNVEPDSSILNPLPSPESHSQSPQAPIASHWSSLAFSAHNQHDLGQQSPHDGSHYGGTANADRNSPAATSTSGSTSTPAHHYHRSNHQTPHMSDYWHYFDLHPHDCFNVAEFNRRLIKYACYSEIILEKSEEVLHFARNWVLYTQSLTHDEIRDTFIHSPIHEMDPDPLDDDLSLQALETTKGKKVLHYPTQSPLPYQYAESIQVEIAAELQRRYVAQCHLYNTLPVLNGDEMGLATELINAIEDKLVNRGVNKNDIAGKTINESKALPYVGDSINHNEPTKTPDQPTPVAAPVSVPQAQTTTTTITTKTTTVDGVTTKTTITTTSTAPSTTTPTTTVTPPKPKPLPLPKPPNKSIVFPVLGYSQIHQPLAEEVIDLLKLDARLFNEFETQQSIAPPPVQGNNAQPPSQHQPSPGPVSNENKPQSEPVLQTTTPSTKPSDQSEGPVYTASGHIPPPPAVQPELPPPPSEIPTAFGLNGPKWIIRTIDVPTLIKPQNLNGTKQESESEDGI